LNVEHPNFLLIANNSSVMAPDDAYVVLCQYWTDRINKWIDAMIAIYKHGD